MRLKVTVPLGEKWKGLSSTCANALEKEWERAMKYDFWDRQDEHYYSKALNHSDQKAHFDSNFIHIDCIWEPCPGNREWGHIHSYGSYLGKQLSICPQFVLESGIWPYYVRRDSCCTPNLSLQYLLWILKSEVQPT